MSRFAVTIIFNIAQTAQNQMWHIGGNAMLLFFRRLVGKIQTAQIPKIAMGADKLRPVELRNVADKLSYMSLFGS